MGNLCEQVRLYNIGALFSAVFCSVWIIFFNQQQTICNNKESFYYTLCLGEGFGSTKGFGILSDMEGSDIYYAGGEYFDTPLNPNS